MRWRACKEKGDNEKENKIALYQTPLLYEVEGRREANGRGEINCSGWRNRKGERVEERI